MPNETDHRAVALRGITKRFANVLALEDVTLEFTRGSVVGLIGENGAGKSTLLNILSGVVHADDGGMSVHGVSYRPSSYADAMRAGIFRVYQEAAFISCLSLAENLTLGFEEYFCRFGLLNSRRRQATVARALRMATGDHHTIDHKRLAGSYGPNVLQIAEIIRARLAADLLEVQSPIILLDEPTAALDSEQVAFLFGLIESLRGKVTFVIVSHRLAEVQAVADYSYVLKDGKVVARADRGTSSESLHAYMVGRQQASDFFHETLQRTQFGEPLLEVEQLSGDGFVDISLTVRSGEVVAVTGLLGSGKEEFARVLAGDRRRRNGAMTICGTPSSVDTPFNRRASGLTYVPPDRAREGFVGVFSVAANISLASLSQHSLTRRGWLSAKAEGDIAAGWVRRLGIKTESVRSRIGSLSGGNQQKVLIARSLQTGSRVIVLDNPTRGIDAGAKGEVYQIIRELASDAFAVLLFCDELPEAIGMANRVVVLKRGRVSGEFLGQPSEKPTEEALLAASL